MSDILGAERANINIAMTDYLSKKFEPYGISGVLIISESHLTIHTWPEYNYVGIDIFTCSKKVEYNEALNYLLEKLGTKKYEIKELYRGTK